MVFQLERTFPLYCRALTTLDQDLRWLDQPAISPSTVQCQRLCWSLICWQDDWRFSRFWFFCPVIRGEDNEFGYKIFRRKPSGLAPRMKPTMQLILLSLQTKLMYHVDVPKWVLDLVSIWENQSNTWYRSENANANVVVGLLVREFCCSGTDVSAKVLEMYAGIRTSSVEL